MLVGLAFAFGAPGRLALPPFWFRVGQAVAGVALGTLIHPSTLGGLGSRWIPVVLVSAATLAVTLLAGVLLARVGRVDPTTASLGMIAGGAAGIVGMADDLGGDDRLVAFMQYTRVLVISLLTPVLAPLAFGAHAAAGGGAGGGSPLGAPGGWALTIGAATAGAVAGARVRMPAPALLGPLVLTAVLSAVGVTGSLDVPPLAREAAFGLIGLQIGLGFDRATLRAIARLLVPVTGSIAMLLVACFGLGWLLTLTTDVSLLDGYLATTPGGLYAVLPIAYGSGADATFVLAVQALRLLAMMLAAPAAVRLLMRSRVGAPRRARATSS